MFPVTSINQIFQIAFHSNINKLIGSIRYWMVSTPDDCIFHISPTLGIKGFSHRTCIPILYFCLLTLGIFLLFVPLPFIYKRCFNKVKKIFFSISDINYGLINFEKITSITWFLGRPYNVNKKKTWRIHLEAASLKHLRDFIITCQKKSFLKVYSLEIFFSHLYYSWVKISFRQLLFCIYSCTFHSLFAH